MSREGRGREEQGITPAWPAPQAGDIRMVYFELEGCTATVWRHKGVTVTRLAYPDASLT